MRMNLYKSALAVAMMSPICLAAVDAHADEPESVEPPHEAEADLRSKPQTSVPSSTFEHAHGVAIDARLRVAAAGLRPVDRAPPIAMGYRGRRFGVLLAPIFGHTRSDAVCGLTYTPCEGSATTKYGAELRTDVTVARSGEDRLELFVAAAANLSGRKVTAPSADAVALIGEDQGLSGEVTWGLEGGAGGRYWLTANVAVLGELLVTYQNYPAGKAGRGEVLREGALAPVGSLGTAFVF